MRSDWILAVLGVTTLWCICSAASPAVAAVPNAQNFRDFLATHGRDGSIENVEGCGYGRFCTDWDASKARAKDDASSNVRANVGYRVHMLAGEPLVEISMNWVPKSLDKMLPPAYARADPTLSSGKTSEAQEKIRLYDARVRLYLKHGVETFSIEDNVGVPARAGNQPSFTMAGSPNWGPHWQSRSIRNERVIHEDTPTSLWNAAQYIQN